MSISTDRAVELAALDKQIQAKINVIDTKYGTAYVEPKLDFPESLGLVHLTFTPKTDAELTAQAQNSVAASFLSQKNSALAAYNKGLDAIALQEGDAVFANSRNLAKLLADYNDNLAKLQRRLVDNGLQFSSVMTSAQKRLLAEYNADVSTENADYEHKRANLLRNKADLAERYADKAASLDEQKSARVAEIVAELKAKQDKEQQAIVKYNSSLDEKEAKYKASCARALEYARQAEYDRALEASKLYAQLGESGFNNQKTAEKLACCRFYLTGLTKEEAVAIVDGTGFYASNLGAAYSTLKQWINDTLAA